MHHRTLAFSLLAALAASPLLASEAHACGGGYFVSAPETETSPATGHRIVASISPLQTVVWDQIQYQGDPTQFAWVYPVKAGSVLQVGNDAWIEALDAITAPRVTSPDLACPSQGCGCGGAAGLANGGGPPVSVTHTGTVGPYETVTLHTSTPGALNTWLTQHGFAVPAGVQPILDGYVAQGFDFIAARLQPDKGIAAMVPMRVVMPGPVTTFPLKMLSAGTKDQVAIELFVLTEGRLDVSGFPGGVIDPTKLVWDFNTNTSNYKDLRATALAAGGGTWLTTFASQGQLFKDSLQGVEVTLSDGSTFYDVYDAYVGLGVSEGATGCDSSAMLAAVNAGQNHGIVAGECPDAGAPDSGPTDGGGGGGTGGGASCMPTMGVDPGVFACGQLDDMAVAMVGMHPDSVWLTRIEAALPRAALVKDLTLTPSTAGPVLPTIQATSGANAPCPLATAAASRLPTGATPTALFAVAFATMLTRKRREKRA